MWWMVCTGDSLIDIFGSLRNNPRLSFMKRTLERMNEQRKSKIFAAAENSFQLIATWATHFKKN